MNYVLQGVNSTNDPKIAEIGKQVYNHFNPVSLMPPTPSTVKNQQDNLKPPPTKPKTVKKKKG